MKHVGTFLLREEEMEVFNLEDESVSTESLIRGGLMFINNSFMSQNTFLNIHTLSNFLKFRSF